MLLGQPHTRWSLSHVYHLLVAGDKAVKCNLVIGRQHLWQSRVEIEHYSVAHFDRITAFVVL